MFAYEPSTRTFLDAFEASDKVDPSVADIREFRKAARQLQLDHACAVPAGVEITNRLIDGRDGVIPIRIYRRQRRTAPSPVLVYLHGGAWVIGGLDECDGLCGYLCRHGEVTVVSVDYRLAPEHKFPAAVHDCIDAVQWVSEGAHELGASARGLGVAGDSAGGNLAAAVCQQLKGRRVAAISRQVLLYPCLAPRDPARYPSRVAYGGEECFLNEAGFSSMLELYRRTPADDSDTMLWPALCRDLRGLPDAYIVTAEFDMLRDEAKAYRDALAASGVTVNYENYSGTIHGFIGFAGTIEPGMRALDDLCGYLRTW